MELTPNFLTVIFEIANFLLLSVLLYLFLFKPIMQKVKERAAEKEALRQELQADRDMAAALREELEARLARAEEEAAEIVERAQEQADQERQALLEEAAAEVERILVDAHAQAHQMRQQALDEFHEELLDAVLEISGMMLGQIAPDDVQATMVKGLSDRIWEMGRSEMQRVESFRLSLGDRVPTAHVRTARPLSSELQGLLVRTFTALADRNVNLDIKVDPDLFLGAQVRLGDIVVDNSVVGQLEALRDQVDGKFRGRMADE